MPQFGVSLTDDRKKFIEETTGAYPRRKHLKVAPIGLALALLSNSKTDWKGFPRTNTLPY